MKGRRYKKQSFISFITPNSNTALYRFMCVFVVLAFLIIIVSAVVIGRGTEQVSNLSIGEPESDPAPDNTSALIGDLTQISVQNTEIGYGNLILVNYQYPCAYEEPQTISMLMESEYGYSIADYNVSISYEVFSFADSLLGEFEAQNGGSSNLNVSCAYRSRELQEQLYNNKIEADGQEEADKWIAKPGYSEHQTGYAFDLSVIKDGLTYEYTGTDEYAWINNNCYKYGFVVRYPIEKAEITKIEHEPWHFRYVGVPHAEYMSKNDLCLEEYIDLLHTTSVSEPLKITAEGGTYAVYYCPADSAASQTQIPVPANTPYTLSGDNINGFIITVEL